MFYKLGQEINPKEFFKKQKQEKILKIAIISICFLIVILDIILFY